MNATQRLLEGVKLARGIKSGYGIAKALGISTQRVYRYQLGQGPMDDDETIIKAAYIAGWSPAEVLAEMHAERATSPEAKKVWKDIAKAAAIAGAMVAPGQLAASPALSAFPAVSTSVDCILC